MPRHCSKTRWIFGSDVGDVPGQRVGVQPVEHLLGALVRELHQVRQGHHRVPGRVARPSARSASCAAACPTCPTRSSRVNSNCLVCGPRIGSGSDSVTRIREARTGRKPSSPSDSRPVEADRLVGQEAQVVGHRQPPGEGPRLVGRHVERLVGGGVAQRRVDRLAGPGVGQASAGPCRSAGAADWLVTLTVNSSTSPSRRNRGGLGWTIRSLAVTTLSCRKPLRSSRVVGEAQELPLGQRLGHGELQLHLAVLVGQQVREEEGGLVAGSCGPRPCSGPGPGRRGGAARPRPDRRACCSSSARSRGRRPASMGPVRHRRPSSHRPSPAAVPSAIAIAAGGIAAAIGIARPPPPRPCRRRTRSPRSCR